MRMTLESYNNMNSLVSMCFEANAIFDNLAYNLEFSYYKNIAKVVHYKVAHAMPEWADKVSDEMLLLSARPTRLELGAHIERYESLSDIFNVILQTLMNMREFCRKMIEDADLQGDDEVRIFGEDFLEDNLSPFIKQAEEWINSIGVIDANSLTIHIYDYTNFIGNDD